MALKCFYDLNKSIFVAKYIKNNTVLKLLKCKNREIKDCSANFFRFFKFAIDFSKLLWYYIVAVPKGIYVRC